jgi:S1-C subfamily serine protease/antitoxin component YwqK of YwqJK toxin-antitoxin module
MVKKIVMLVLCNLFISTIFSQKNTQYLDKEENIVEEESAYSLRKFNGEVTKPSGEITWTYVSNNKVYFEGKILAIDLKDPQATKYRGACKWYYKNGNLKAERTFTDNGMEDGVSKYYYENGKLKTKYTFDKGKLDYTKVEDYDESGARNLLFIESFANNNNDWDTYNSDKSFAKLVSGKLELESYTKQGTSRYIAMPLKSDDWSYELEFSYPEETKNIGAHGILFNFKDWDNHGYFFVTNDHFTLGFIAEGIKSSEASQVFTSNVNKTKNVLKIVSKNDKLYFSINGEIEYNMASPNFKYSNFGPVIFGKSKVYCDNIIFKEFNSDGTSTADLNKGNWKSSGSGLVFSKDGYIVTNYHVIEESKSVTVDLKINGEIKSYKAVVKNFEKENDLAIIKIEDENFKNFSSIDYTIKDGGAQVGASVFTLGYPLSLSGMGSEVKFTDGKISAKTGYNNAVNSYQTSVPVQPGNSGGPLFTTEGQLIGVVNSVVRATDNVSYAIKINYFKNLVDLLPTAIDLPNTAFPSNAPIEDIIKKVSPYIVNIKLK